VTGSLASTTAMHTSARSIRAVGTQAGVVLVSGGLLDPAADPSRVDEPIDLPVHLDELVDGIHCGSRNLIDDHPLLPSQLC
jgi:hypothetical protein